MTPDLWARSGSGGLEGLWGFLCTRGRPACRVRRARTECPWPESRRKGSARARCGFSGNSQRVLGKAHCPGIEPGSQAWEACVMPLRYARSCLHAVVVARGSPGGVGSPKRRPNFARLGLGRRALGWFGRFIASGAPATARRNTRAAIGWLPTAAIPAELATSDRTPRTGSTHLPPPAARERPEPFEIFRAFKTS